MSELYGAPSGFQAAIADQHTLATTRYNNALANKMDVEAKQSQKLQQLMSQQGLGLEQIGTETDPVSKLTNLSNLALQSGQVKLGAELADKASLIQRRRTQDDQSLAAIEKTEFETGLKTINLASELAKGSTDDISWRRANATFELLTGKISPYRALPYSPELVKTIRDSMTTEAQKLTANYQQKEYSRKLAHDFEAEEIARDNLALRKQEFNLRKQREERMAKNGGAKLKPAGMPSKAEVEVATNLLEKMGFTDVALEDTAMDVAQEARRLWKANAALTPQEAVAQVILQKQKNGDLIPGKQSNIISFKPTLGVKGKSYSPLRPAENPGSKDALEVGQYYNTVRGVARWNGKAFVITKQPKPSTVNEEDEGDDDE